ncbi:MAG TPA: hypothetical protein VLY24_11820 [Bryobacteraceae bacterium]|nr:hypothetical protein [Bryobacteraceae bacterium]
MESEERKRLGRRFTVRTEQQKKRKNDKEAENQNNGRIEMRRSRVRGCRQHQ